MKPEDDNDIDVFDYFAARCMEGLIASGESHSAHLAYDLAGDMFMERKRRREGPETHRERLRKRGYRDA